MTPGGKPVTAVPGLTPTLPLTVVAPVFVTVEPPRTPKLCAVPREICATIGVVAKRKNAVPSNGRATLDLIRTTVPFRLRYSTLHFAFVRFRRGKLRQ